MSDEELKPEQRGYYTREELEDILPSKEEITNRRTVIIECTEDIPCNPCAASCPVGAITKNDLITPGEFDWEKCIGCAQCVAACPALSIFMQEIKDGKGYVTLAYEFLPKPEVGDKVKLLNRAGDLVGYGKIVKPTYQVKEDKRWIVTVEMDDPELSYEVRAIKIEK